MSVFLGNLKIKNTMACYCMKVNISIKYKFAKFVLFDQVYSYNAIMHFFLIITKIDFNCIP